VSGLSGGFGGEGDTTMCIHEYPGGKGCYLCDPNHPYRIKQRATA
jgi:hypothetical protein